jgi:pilus assembly protein Flp/PilA
MLKRLFTEEEGQGLVEYALIIALIAVVAIVAIRLLGTTTSDKLNEVSTELQNAS